MAIIGILIFAAFAIDVVPAPFTKYCLVCDGVQNPNTCTNTARCHGDEDCFTSVVERNGRHLYYKGCKKSRDCGSTWIIGRSVHHGHETTDYAVCETCCQTSGCNSKGCDQYYATTNSSLPTSPTTIVAFTTTATSNATASTTTQTSTRSSSIQGGSCRDHEEDGISCSSYESFNFCSETDQTSLTYRLAHTKCPKYCGFCTASSSVQQSSCRDHEEDGLSCSMFDKFNICSDTDPDSLPYSLAHSKCQKHCGLCATGSAVHAVTPSSSSNQGLTTGGLSTRISSSTTHQTAKSTTRKPCVDHEDANFSCADWAKRGYCNTPMQSLHDISIMRCYRYCGFC